MVTRLTDAIRRWPMRSAARSLLFHTMQTRNLWAPWRMQYLETMGGDSAGASASAADAAGGASARSFLLDYWAHPERDAENYVVHRDARGMILLNLYPYANGHLLVALGDARPRLLDYEPAQRAAFWRLVDLASDLVERALNPQGLNVGLNQGKAAGAGIPQHLHAHVVPRWGGDTNFITVVGAIRVVPEALDSIHARFLKVLPAVLAVHAGT